MLSEERRRQLDDIVLKMHSAKEQDSTIQFVVDDFKAKYENEAQQAQPVQPKKSLFGKVTDFLVGSEKKFGQTLGDAVAVQYKDVKGAMKSQVGLDDKLVQLGNKIKEFKKAGKDTTSLMTTYKNLSGSSFDLGAIAPSANKTPLQIYGEAGGVAMDILSAGTYGKAVGTTGKLLTKTAEKAIPKTIAKTFAQGVIKEAPKGALIGAGFGATQAMQENKSTSDILKSSATGAITGGILSGLIGGIAGRNAGQAPAKAEALKQRAVEQYQRGLNSGKEKYKVLGEKIIPDLLKENKWGTFKGLMKKADDGIALSGKEYEQLGELQGLVETSGIIDKIDGNIAKMLRPDGTVISVKQTSYNQLQSLKDDIMAYSTKSAVAGEAKETLIAEQQKLRELAQNYGKELYDTRKAMKTINDSKTLSQVKEVDSAIREILNKENPAYAKINKLYHLNTSLKDILIDTAQRKNSHKFINIVRTLTGSGGAGFGAILGGLPGAIAGGIALTGTAEILNSTWYNTLKAVQKNQLADKILAKSQEEIAPTILLLARQGAKYFNELMNE